MRPHRNRFCSFSTVVLSVLALTQIVVAQSPTPTPGRISDKDLATLMNNLKDDAKSFRPRFDSSIKKSTIRKTSQAKDAMSLASDLEKQAAATLNTFKKTKKGDGVPVVLNTASQIEKYIHDLNLDPQAIGWDKVRADLNQISSAFGIAPPNGADSRSRPNPIPC